MPWTCPVPSFLCGAYPGEMRSSWSFALLLELSCFLELASRCYPTILKRSGDGSKAPAGGCRVGMRGHSMPRPGHVSKPKPPHDIHSQDHQSFQCSLCLACSFHTLQFVLVDILQPSPNPPPRAALLANPACLGCGKFGPCSTRWSGLAWTAGFQPLPHLTPNAPLLHSPRPLTHQENTISVALLGWGSMHRSPAQAATAQSLRCPRMPSREPQRRLACRHRGTHLPRNPRGMGGLWPGDPNGIERDDLASARGCPEPRGQPGGTKSKRKRYK